jgi:hypothetical protein
VIGLANHLGRGQAQRPVGACEFAPGDTDRDTFVITLPAGVAVRGAAVGRRRRNDDVLLHRPSARPAPPPTSPGVPRGAGSEEKAPSPGHQPRPLPQAARGGPLTRSHPKPPDEHAHLATHPPVTGSVRITAHRAGPPPPSSTPSAVTHQETQRLPARARWPTRPGSQGPSSAPPRHRALTPASRPAGHRRSMSSPPGTRSDTPHPRLHLVRVGGCPPWPHPSQHADQAHTHG